MMIGFCVCGCPDEEPPVVMPQVENNATPGEALIGEPCARTSDCAALMVCDRASERGYCRPALCEQGCDEAGGVCASLAGQPGQCWAPCDGALELTGGVKCVEVEGVRVVTPQEQPEEFVEFERVARDLEVVCESAAGPRTSMGPTREFSFALGAQDTSFMVVNTIATDDKFFPMQLTTPDEQEVDLVLDYRHHNARIGDMEQPKLVNTGRYGAVSVDWSILFPYAASKTSLVQEGAYTMSVASNDESLCFYVLKDQGGDTLDLNFYFTDYVTFNAVHATADEDFQEVIERVRAIYAQAGIKLGTLRYFNVPEEGRRYRVLRELSDIKQLTALGSSPVPGRRGALSVDIFLVDAIAIEEAMVLGVSAGIPGAPGMHGNPSNGLIFGLNDLGANNKGVAHIMAHEIGHYLGLRHTTEFAVGTSQEPDFERFVGARDPLADTVECSSLGVLGRRCPDAKNLMFPAAPSASDDFLPEISKEQTDVFIASPLTHGD